MRLTARAATSCAASISDRASTSFIHVHSNETEPEGKAGLASGRTLRSAHRRSRPAHSRRYTCDRGAITRWRAGPTTVRIGRTSANLATGYCCRIVASRIRTGLSVCEHGRRRSLAALAVDVGPFARRRPVRSVRIGERRALRRRASLRQTTERLARGTKTWSGRVVRWCRRRGRGREWCRPLR
jgi:hypothetical protein